jgi:hypothetical protein
MSQKQKPNLAAALAEVGGSTRRRLVPLRSEKPVARREKAPAENGAGRESPKNAQAPEGQGSTYQAPSRSGTVPITGHFPKQVRDQLKILAIQEGSTLHTLMAEAYNDLFAKYGIPEIAPRQSMKLDK